MPAATIATPISDVPLHDWTPAADHLSFFTCHPILCLEPVISAKPKRCLDKITTTPRDLLLIRLCLLYQTTRLGTMCDIGRIIITPLASITGKEVSHGNFSVTDGNAFFFLSCHLMGMNNVFVAKKTGSNKEHAPTPKRWRITGKPGNGKYSGLRVNCSCHTRYHLILVLSVRVYPWHFVVNQ